MSRAILRTFVHLGQLTPQAADILVGWEPERSGFSLFIGPVIPAEQAGWTDLSRVRSRRFHSVRILDKIQEARGQLGLETLAPIGVDKSDLQKVQQVDLILAAVGGQL